MDNDRRRRGTEILARIDRSKRTRNETKAFDTLASQARLIQEAQDELRRVRDKLARLAGDM